MSASLSINDSEDGVASSETLRPSWLSRPGLLILPSLFSTFNSGVFFCLCSC